MSPVLGVAPTGVALGLGAWILVVACALAVVGAVLAGWSLWRTRNQEVE